MAASLTAEQILSKLVSFDTTSSDSNLALIEWVEEYLKPYGAYMERVNETNEQGVKKAALLVRIGPKKEGGIVLSGHTDVVPVKGQQWTGGKGPEKAFILSERDGKLYGRGSADMKGFIALALAEVPKWSTQELKRPVWLALSFDEEIGCKCAEPLAKEFIAHTIKPQLIIVGEPTMMEVVDEHKGIDGFETIITGKAGHSSAPQDGVNAAYAMAELALLLRDINAEEAKKGEVNSRFVTNYSTIHLGVAHAGTARNIIPDTADMLWEVRPMPGKNSEAFRARFDAKAAELMQRYGCMIETHQLSHVHGLKRVANAPYLHLASYLAGSNTPTSAVSYATEGGGYSEQGFPTVICGPGDIAQAHGPDEYVACTQLAKGAEMMARVGEVLQGDGWQGHAKGQGVAPAR